MKSRKFLVIFNYFSWGLQIVISVILIKKGIMAKYFQV